MINRLFARLVGVDLSESAQPPENYPSLSAFFTRDLKAGARPLGEGVLSPADGRLVIAGTIAASTLIQAKGRDYRVEDLLAGYADVGSFLNGYYLTIYLSPKDYHHVHSPVNGQLVQSCHVPGMLWPVNVWSVNNIANLFCVNERVISLIRTSAGTVAVVMVGATNVGSISVAYDDFRSNDRFFRGNRSPQWRSYPSEPGVKAGDRLGTFHLGSTVIVVFPAGVFIPSAACVPGPIRYGCSLGALKGL